ncbi:tubulin-like doman-containing protein [Aquabacter sp. P-9]|uniref:tubulin-like doman-containing protein n=1 Tax=Aquabacter sediminis TaxID=3029197 RepID=UPI00237E91C4|nr:tubulin-like doman-containing protein [Aquabacter sp. P-9]MDE1567855.1 tubulin-like doman-containing protein [Aquabacter sp. P-9]
MTDSTATEPTPTQNDVMPTVFIALGGTGMEILLRLRRRILQHNWGGQSLTSLDEFPPARFVYFDTDMADARESGRAAATDLLASRVAFSKGSETIQKKVDTAWYKTEKEDDSEIGEWLPDGALDKIDTEKGAGQVRAISRLLFFHEYENFIALVRAQVDRVTQNVTNTPALQNLKLKTGTKPRVVVVASSAGGTGSGSFIDVGYALRSLRSPTIEQVDLFLMLPGGYQSANKDRVFANTYAALSELEFAMRGSTNPAYVTQWGRYAKREQSVTTPYSNVWLFDNQNIVNQNTGNKEDLFDMVADILFEEFGSSEFARRKSSVSVNQKQHMITNWFPDLPAWLDKGLSYSTAYSAVGQSTVMSKASIQVEEYLARNNAAMVRTFFGLSLNDQQKLATTDDRDTFLQERLRLFPKAFQDDYDARARFEQPPITDFGLVDYLLLRADKSSIAVTLASEIEQDFAGIISRMPAHQAWEAEVRKLAEMRWRDVEGRVGEGAAYGPKGMEVGSQRQRLEDTLLSKGVVEGSLRADFYTILDDQARGGLEYTIDLVSKVQARLEEQGTGSLARLVEAEEAYANRANRLQAEQLQASIDRLKQAGESSFLTGGGRKACEKYLSQVRDDLIACLQARLRAIACREAAALLRKVAGFLGKAQDIDAKGETIWTGLIGEFQKGRARVRGLLSVVEADVARLQDALRRGNGGTFFVIKDKGIDLAPEDTEQQLAWAREAFHSIGGSREIFQRLETDDGRLHIFSLLRTVTDKYLGDRRERIPSVVDALRQLRLHEQQEFIDLMIKRSMPWIHAEFSHGFRTLNDRFKMIIAVNDARAFRAEYDEMIKSRLPAEVGLTSLNYEESGIPGRILCYCELRGFPLDVINPLRSDWRPSYLKEQDKSDKLPLHNHKDELRFPDPVVPRNSELGDLRNRMQLFLEGVMLGILRFESNKGLPVYKAELIRGQLDQIGDEKNIRRRGFNPVHFGPVTDAIRRKEDGLGYIQFLALAALADWFAKHVYTMRLVEMDRGGATIRRGGVGHHVSRGLAKEFTSRAAQIGGSLPDRMSPEDAIASLKDQIHHWTTSIPGTVNDVDQNEVSRDLNDPPDQRATDKRTINWERFTEAALYALLKPETPAWQAQQIAAPATPERAVQVAVPPVPPAPPSLRFWLFNPEGQVIGPFDVAAFQMLGQLGQLRPDTKVCAEGSQQWQSVADIPVLFALVRSATPPPPPPPPAPPL